MKTKRKKRREPTRQLASVSTDLELPWRSKEHRNPRQQGSKIHLFPRGDSGPDMFQLLALFIMDCILLVIFQIP